MAAIDAEYWDKCVSKVMKEVHQYMIYDGLVTEDVVEDNVAPESPLADSIPEEGDDDIMPHTSSYVPANNTEEENDDNLVPESPLANSIPEEGDSEIMPHTSSFVPANNIEEKNDDDFKNFIVKQCTEELISPTKLASMYKKSEKTIRQWVKSSGVPLPQKYQQKLQQKITFLSNIEDHSLSRANNATQSLAKELILNLKSKWPSLSTANETSTTSHPGGIIH